MKPVRKRAQAINKGRGGDHRVVIPLAFELAARIAARDVAAFRTDATQLANGLTELQRAVQSDGIVVALAGEMELQSAAGRGLDADAIIASGPVAASLEACRRLRHSYADDIVLVAGLTGPATLAQQFAVDLTRAGACFAALVKAFCAAGADLVLVIESDAIGPDDDWLATVKTADNIARFHQAGMLAWHDTRLPGPVMQSLAAPSSAGLGFITTDVLVPADADLEQLRGWVANARGA